MPHQTVVAERTAAYWVTFPYAVPAEDAAEAIAIVEDGVLEPFGHEISCGLDDFDAVYDTREATADDPEPDPIDD